MFINLDANQVLFIIVVVLFLLYFGIAPVIFRNHKAGVSRYFRKHPDVRFDLIKSADESLLVDVHDLSNMEILAILSLILTRKSVSEAFSAAKKYASENEASRFDEVFFSELDSAARDFITKGWNRTSSDLYRLGHMIARDTSSRYWAEQFQESLRKITERQLEGNLPAKTR